MKIPKKSDIRNNIANLNKSGIYLWLDSYNDIFSDFDSRPYNKRATSSDFLEEAKRASMDKEDKINLQLFLPAEKRDVHNEKVIKDRLHEHFRRHHHMLQEEAKNIKKKGFYFVLAGIALMFMATLILFKYTDTQLITSFLVVFLEPAGWFLFWEGLNLILFESKRKHKDLMFYKKMSNSTIQFFSEQ
jgi:hypothetical protein